jgi:hypothetical protein
MVKISRGYSHTCWQSLNLKIRMEHLGCFVMPSGVYSGQPENCTRCERSKKRSSQPALEAPIMRIHSIVVVLKTHDDELALFDRLNIRPGVDLIFIICDSHTVTDISLGYSARSGVFNASHHYVGSIP